MPIKPRILLVDDEPFILSMMRSFLDERQFDIHTASCGNEAIALIRKEKYDCVVSDVRMPNGTGFQLLGWMREIDPVKPTLIFVTGYSDIPSDELLAKGADTYIAKPFNVEDFANEITLRTKSLVERLSLPVTIDPQAKHLKLQASNFAAITKPGTCLKLGRGGMFVPMSVDGCRVFQSLTFEVTFPDGPAFKGSGKILWLRKAGGLSPKRSGLGIIFESLDQDSVHAFSQFVDQQTPIEVIPQDC